MDAVKRPGEWGGYVPGHPTPIAAYLDALGWFSPEVVLFHWLILHLCLLSRLDKTRSGLRASFFCPSLHLCNLKPNKRG